jgi:hypothetical protein
MSAVESFRSKAEAYLEKARKVSDRSRAQSEHRQAENRFWFLAGLGRSLPLKIMPKPKL